MRRAEWLGPRFAAALVHALSALCLGALLAGCGAGETPREREAIVFRHPKLFGDPEALERLLAEFERESGLRVRRETLPASSDEQHLFYAINLQAGAREFDVFALDVIWVAEFARAGWLRELTPLVPDADRADLFPGPLAAVTWGERIYALPWFVDAGLLYYRKDLLAKHGLSPPATWAALVDAARVVRRGAPGLYGFVWQGKQYEGLVCNALEFVRGHGGELAAGGADLDASIRGLDFMRSLVADGVTPRFVTTLTEEPSRVIFGQGRALFLRNWPYAWQLLAREGSPVRGKVGVTALPHAPGRHAAATLGGWQLGVNAFSVRPQAAERLAAFLASARAQKALALAYGYAPPRRSLYEDPELAAAQPFLASLRPVFEAARPRPVSPHYVALSQVLQSELSGVLTGSRESEAAVHAIDRAHRELERR
jgi:multiple sugar transport system substrate-binding protein